MDKQEQRIAIAKSCGYNPVESQFYEETGTEKLYGWLENKNYWKWVPDYLNDLNAMYEAEKVLGWGQMGSYTTRLDRMDDNSHGVHTTAAQRAEAFLKTLNLWDTDQH